jgi:predicted membrane protein
MPTSLTPGSVSPEPDRTARNIGVGCFTFFVGIVSGAMTAVLVGKMYAFLSRAPACSEMPLCEWPSFALAGAILGAVTLPALAFWRLRRVDERSDRAANDTSNRG